MAIETGDMTPPQGGEGVTSGRRASRRIPAALFWLLASIAILASGMAVWAHQTLLTANGWGSLVGEVAADPEVVEGVSVALVDRLSEAVDLRGVVADAIPGPDIVAGAISARVQDELVNAMATFAATDTFQDAFVRVNEAAHEAAMKAIRGGESAALTSEGGAITLNVFPLIEGVLLRLQEAGLIDASREIPDLTDFQPSARAVAGLETLLGRDLPDDLGTITLVDSERLEAVQTAVRWFDLITVVLLLLAVVFVALALWLAERRLRMVMWLGVGAIVALLTGRVVTRLVLEGVVRRQEEPGAQVLVRAVVDAAVDSLMWFTFILMALAAIVALVAWVAERREAGAREALETPPRILARWLRANTATVLAVGIGLILVLALWRSDGPDNALLVAAGIGLLVIAVHVLSRDDAAGEAAGEPG